MGLRVQYEVDEVTLGNTIPVPQASTSPLVQLHSAVSGKLYTFAMVDPDAPSRKNPRAAQWNHWLLTNIKGPHRYVFVVYEQPEEIEAKVSRSRARFRIGDFAEKNGLGAPMAGNFFFAENK